jgi:hypothetical protein
VRTTLHGRRERGAALALAVVALFVLGGLASTAFLLSFAEFRVGRKFVRLQQASAAADAGAYSTVARWDAEVYNRLPIGGSASFTGGTVDETGSYEGIVTRLAKSLYLVTSEGTSSEGAVRQRAGVLMRLRPLQLTVNAALEIRGPLHIEPTARINGYDQSPYGWNCPPASEPLPAVRVPSPDSGVAPWSGCDPAQCLDGDPLFETSSFGSGSGVVDLGGSTLTDLKAIANHRLSGGSLWISPVESNGICVTENPENWGDPYDRQGACGDHFPAVYSIGDLIVRGGQGQGILVVDGDLTIGGDFHFFGVAIVLGRFQTVGLGSQITGAVIVLNSDLEPQSLSDNTRILYSSCAVAEALAGSGRGVLLRERSWLDMY